ncbi:uncharacterized protein LOC110869870 [Helianthus annuus]|uniref:uncharacterized protein LOC110869870 n=1 Tax=Helianthus annuus TaxID=4232 RepID=UPI000B8FF76F|nr:uncharacterized protein LOC110869870 [Helianthus annuus]
MAQKVALELESLIVERRSIVFWSLEGRSIPTTYIDIVKDTYVGTETSVRAQVGDTDFFPVEVGLHQGSALSPFLFAVVLDGRAVKINSEDCSMIKQSLNVKLEEWRAALVGKGLKISRSKTEYLYFNFSGAGDGEDIGST